MSLELRSNNAFTGTQNLLLEARSYEDRVASDGGVVEDISHINGLIDQVQQHGLYDNLSALVSANGGRKTDAS